MIGFNILTCNRTPQHLAATKAAILSLMRSDLPRGSAPARIVIVDNGSTDSTVAWLTAWAAETSVPVTVVPLRENLGIAAARNIGYRLLLEDPALWAVAEIHNDMIFPGRWLRPLIETLQGDDRVGLASSCLLTHRGVLGSPTVKLSYDWPVDRLIATVDRHAATTRLFAIRPGLQHPVLKRVAMLREIGLYDEGFRWGNFEDTDEVKRAADAGWLYVVIGASVVYHHYTMSRTTLTPDHSRVYLDNRRWFFAKHADAAAFLARYQQETEAIYK